MVSVCFFLGIIIVSYRSQSTIQISQPTHDDLDNSLTLKINRHFNHSINIIPIKTTQSLMLWTAKS